MVKILIECGIDPQKKCKCAGTTASALAFALVSQKIEIFEFLRSCENYKNTVLDIKYYIIKGLKNIITQ